MIETKKPLISVVIPVHNGQNYLAAAIQSVFEQNGLFELDVIVVDDGSTDKSARIAQDIPLVRYHYQVSQGAAAARNTGVGLARGDYIAFLDADDLWLPEKLAMQLEILQHKKDLSMVFCMVQQFISPELDDKQRAGIACPEQPMPAYIPSGLLIKKSTFIDVGEFQTQWRVGEFIDWYGRAKELGYNSTALANTLLKRRLHLTNTGVTERDSRQDFAKILKASLDRKRNAQG